MFLRADANSDASQQDMNPLVALMGRLNSNRLTFSRPIGSLGRAARNRNRQEDQAGEISEMVARALSPARSLARVVSGNKAQRAGWPGDSPLRTRCIVLHRLSEGKNCAPPGESEACCCSQTRRQARPVHVSGLDGEDSPSTASPSLSAPPMAPAHCVPPPASIGTDATRSSRPSFGHKTSHASGPAIGWTEVQRDANCQAAPGSPADSFHATLAQ
jgi:hypothetical protein